MSTELQSPDAPSDAAPAPSVAAKNGASPVRQPGPLPRRRFQLGAALLVLVVLAAAVANNLLARQYTPDGAVSQYLAAVKSGDSASAWSQVEVGVPFQSVAATLTDAAAMQAALAVGRPDIRSFDVTGTSNPDSSPATVSLTINASNGSRHVTATVGRSGDRRFGLYPVWRVILTPVLLTITLPKGASGITIDGKAIALPGGKSVVAVLPLPHKIVFNPTPVLASQTVPVDAFTSGNQTVAYQPQFTSAGMAKAKAAVAAYFGGTCAKQTSAQPDRAICPQTVGTYLPYSGQWQLVGDPTNELGLTTDQDGNLAALGHYQMVFAYSEDGVQGVRHVPAGGGYSASILLNGSDLAVGNIQSNTGSSVLERPAAATDQAAKDRVSKAFVQCASVSAETVADCPQAAPDVIIQNVHWTLGGDPVSGATISYDGTTGLFTVHGSFSMGVSYTWFGDARKRSSYVTAYDAYLFWDGQALQLVTIDGAQ